MTDPPGAIAGRGRGLLPVLFVLGLGLSLVMLVRGQPAGDQLNLLARGWLLAARGVLIPFGNPLSTGGHEPGALTSLLVGLPLVVWRDYRAPVVAILLGHLLAYFLLDRVARAAGFGRHGRVLLALVYWLNPWRLYFSGVLWNPSYLLPLGAVHLWTAFAQRERPRFGMTLLQVLAIGCALQIHASWILLAAASALLWWRGYQRVHWGAVATGAGLTAASLVPWALAALAQREILAAHQGFLFRGLVTVLPILRGVGYWLRYGSLAIAEKMLRFDFSALFGAGVDRWLAPTLLGLARVAGIATLLAALAANLWLARRRGREGLDRWPPGAEPRQWLEGYVVWSFVGAVVVFCAAPTTIMMWQVLALFHAAVLPVVFWLEHHLAGARAARARRALLAAANSTQVIDLGMAFRSPHYRCGGRHDVRFPLAHDSPMFAELGIERDCPWPLNRPDGWWPDVLPAE